MVLWVVGHVIVVVVENPLQRTNGFGNLFVARCGGEQNLFAYACSFCAIHILVVVIVLDCEVSAWQGGELKYLCGVKIVECFPTHLCVGVCHPCFLNALLVEELGIRAHYIVIAFNYWVDAAFHVFSCLYDFVDCCLIFGIGVIFHCVEKAFFEGVVESVDFILRIETGGCARFIFYACFRYFFDESEEVASEVVFVVDLIDVPCVGIFILPEPNGGYAPITTVGKEVITTVVLNEAKHTRIAIPNGAVLFGNFRRVACEVYRQWQGIFHVFFHAE